MRARRGRRFRTGRVLPAVEQHFGARRAPAWRRDLPDEAVPLAPREAHLFRMSRSPAPASAADPGPGVRHTPVLDLLGTVLGYGNSCILWEELREKRRLVHSIEASALEPGARSVSSRRVDALRPGQARGGSRRRAGGAGQDRAARRAAGAAEQGRAPARGGRRHRKTMSGQASRLGLAEVVVGDLPLQPALLRPTCQSPPRPTLRRVAAKYFVPSDHRGVDEPQVATAGAVAAVPAAELGISPRSGWNGVRLLLLPTSACPTSTCASSAWRGGASPPRGPRRAR